MATNTQMADQVIQPNRLFLLSCLSLIVTAMTFAIRAGILGQLNTEFGLSDTQLGWVNGMAFLGFPFAMVIFGFLYNTLGPRLIMIFAFFGHLLGLGLTIFAGGFLGLLISTFFIGFANGSVEAACNPMIADMYKNEKTKWLNRFHVWFPGGIVIGSLVSYFMTKMGLGWQSQIGIMIVPTLIYGYMVFTTVFPAATKSEGINQKGLIVLLGILALLAIIGTPNSLIAAIPLGVIMPLLLVLALVYVLVKLLGGRDRDAILLIVIMGIMSLTATSEFGPQQWVERILGSSGASPMLILAMVTGMMAVGRFFAGPVVHALNPVGVLLMSAILTALGIFLMSQASGVMVYVSAMVFAIGVCYFWPTMIGFTGEYIPRTGALGMSLVGAAGMFAMTFWNPVIGGWIDGARETAKASGVTGDAIEIAAGRGALTQLVYFPALLILLFAILFVLHKKIAATAGETNHG